jgi:hypothetical protein
MNELTSCCDLFPISSRNRRRSASPSPIDTFGQRRRASWAPADPERINGKETGEVQYYISSLKRKLKLFAQAQRGHWGIENTCYWTLDMTFREDESRARERHVAENLSWLSLRPGIAQTTPRRQNQLGHEAPRLRLEHRLPDGSPFWSKGLVCANRDAKPALIVGSFVLVAICQALRV